MRLPQPEAQRAAALARSDMMACRAMLREGSYTFFAASLLLPRAVREPASALYAFCRLADDAVDHDGNQASVTALRERLAQAYAAEAPAIAADRALAQVIARFRIPRALPQALLDGFEWDAQGRRYESLQDLHDYAARVAGTVGAMMALLMGVRTASGIARACDLGVAMQLSNIARDVGEDARMGRLYLPLQWLREAGLDPDGWLARPVFSPALASVVERLLQEADRLYARVDAGVAELPLACRPGINAARFLYAEIGQEVRRRQLDSVASRAVVNPSRKALLLARSLAALRPARVWPAQPALPATQYLVDAAMAAGAGSNVRTLAASPLDDRIEWLVGLFERLERRDQLRQLSRQTPAS